MGEKKLKLENLWTLDDLAQYLKLPRSSAHLLVATRKIPFVKLGKHLRFIPSDVETALRKMAT